MADDIELNAGSGGATLRTDDDGSAHWQYVKLAYGADDTQTIVAAANPIPVGGNTAKDGSGTAYAFLLDSDGHAQVDVLSIAAGDNNIGNVDIVTLPATAAEAAALPNVFVVVAGDDGTDTHPLQTDANGYLKVSIAADALTGLEVIQPTAGDFNCTEASAAAIKTAVEIIADWDETDRAKVNVIAGQAGVAAGAGAVGVTVPRVTLASDDPAVALLNSIDTDTSKITACNTGAVVIASGTVTTVSAVTAITNALPAGDNNIGNVDVLTMPANTTESDTITAVAGTVTITLAAGCGTVALQITGTWVGQIEFEGSIDGTNYQSVEASNGTAVVNATAGNDIFILPGAGYVKIRVRASAWTSGTATVTLVASIGTSASILTGAIPAGSNAIGKLAANDGVDIGDVDVTSVVPGTAATSLGKARGSALGATDTGVAPLGVRNDDLADLAGADGDYTPLQVDNQGALYVNQAAAEPKQASGVAAGGTPGTDDMIAAVAGKKLLVLALSLFATSATTNTIYIDNADNDLLGNSSNGIALSLDADGDTVAGFVLPYNPGGWFKTDTVNEPVTLNSSAAEDIIWCITYIETD